MIYALSDGWLFILACMSIFFAITGANDMALLISSVGIATCVALLSTSSLG